MEGFEAMEKYGAMEEFEGTIKVSFRALDVNRARRILRRIASEVLAHPYADGISTYIAHRAALLEASDQPGEMLRLIEYEIL